MALSVLFLIFVILDVTLELFLILSHSVMT